MARVVGKLPVKQNNARVYLAVGVLMAKQDICEQINSIFNEDYAEDQTFFFEKVGNVLFINELYRFSPLQPMR